MSWREEAACQGSDLFFHPHRIESVPKTLGAALQICDSCPVIEECAAEQKRYPAFGVYGGEWFPVRAEHAR